MSNDFEKCTAVSRAMWKRHTTEELKTAYPDWVEWAKEKQPDSIIRADLVALRDELYSRGFTEDDLKEWTR